LKPTTNHFTFTFVIFNNFSFLTKFSPVQKKEKKRKEEAVADQEETV
jgi:hypothetical protein